MDIQIPENVDYVEALAGYLRVSTQEQKLHGLSLEAQKEKLEEYAKEHNCRIVQWYIDEGISGRKPIAKRPALQQMAQDAQKGLFQRIIFIKLDRFFRSVGEYHEYMKLIDPVIWTATEEKYDLSTANGRAFVNMKLTIAELEADTGSERVTITNDYKIKAGLPLFGNNCMPFCYSVVHEEGDRHKQIIKNPKTRHVMEDLLEHYMRYQSVRGSAQYINNKYGCDMSYKAFKNVLSNEMICGHYRGNPNYCDPYIDKTTFDRMQDMLKRNPRTPKMARTYMFSGLIRCPECGWTLSGQPHKNAYGIYYNVYRCTQYKQQRHRCSFSKCVYESTVEKRLLATIGDHLARAKAQNVRIESEKQRVSKYNLEELQQELDRLNYAWQKGRIKGGVEQYDREYDDLMAKIEAAQKEEAEFARVDYSAAEAILASDWRTIYDALDVEHKRAFWRSFISEIHIKWETKDKEVVDIKFV